MLYNSFNPKLIQTPNKMKNNLIKLKKTLLVILFITGINTAATAQNIRLNAYTAYVLEDNVDSYYDPYSYYDGQIDGGFQWGIGLEFMPSPTKGIELKYLRRDATAPMKYYNNGEKYKTFDLALNYILIGGSNYFQTGGKVEPYAGGSIGAVIVNIQNAEAGSDDSGTKFAWGLKVGTNIWATEKVGLKLQIDLLSAVQSVGGGLYFGTGGAGAGVSAYSTMYQWVFGGGLTFKLGQ